MSKKIVISSNTSWSIYNFRLNLIKTLKEKGYEVVIVAPYDEYSERLSEGFEYYDIFMNNKRTNPIGDMKTFIQYYKIYNDINTDIALHFTIKPNIYGTLACKLLNIKTINNITGLGAVFIRDSFITKVVKKLYRIVLYNSDKVFFQNSDDFRLFLNNKLVQKNKCDVLPGSGVDTRKFKPIKIEKKNNIFRFLLIARMLWDKGVGEYVEAATIIKQKYNNVEFLLLGAVGVDNPTAISKEQIEKWERKGIVKYLGITDDVRNEIAKADCVVLPSYREGTSRVLLESAAMEKPLVTTNVPGCKVIVEDNINGFLCKVKDTKDLANKMQKMLNLTEEKRIAMGKKGREQILKQFDEKIVIQNYLQTVEKLLS